VERQVYKQTEQTASIHGTRLATRHLLSHAGHPPSLTQPVKQICRIQSAAEIVGEKRESGM